MRGQVKGFFEFIREQGVISLAIGFILGGAITKLVASIVENILNPLIGLGLGKVNLSQKLIHLSNGPDGQPWTGDDITLKYGAALTTFIDFLLIAAVVYFGIKGLKLDKLDKKKDK